VAKDLGADVPLLDIMGIGSLGVMSVMSEKVGRASKLAHLEK
jgi:hypothetical protein